MKIVYLFPNNNKEKTANRIQTIKFTNAMANVLENKFLFISGNGYRQNRWHIQLKYLFNRFHTLQFLFFVLLKKYITQNDILYIRDYKLLKYISFLKKIKILTNNIVCEVHDIPKDEVILKLMLKSSKLIAISKPLKEKLVCIGYDPKNTFIAHDGFDNNEKLYSVNSSVINRLDSHNTIVYTGGYQSWKNIEFIIQIANRLKEVNFLFIGLDKTKVSDCLLSDNIYFVDYLEHKFIHGILHRFDYAILSLNMNYEIANYTSPLKLFEYLSAGLTVFAPNVENIKEIIQSDKNGYLYDFDLVHASQMIEYIIFQKKKLNKDLIKNSVVEYSWINRARNISKWLLNND